MNALLEEIYNPILEGCVHSAEMGLIMESPFKYNNCLDDIIVNIKGEVYGDGISFQRGKLTSIEVKSNVHHIDEQDSKDFSKRLSEDFYKIINKI